MEKDSTYMQRSIDWKKAWLLYCKKIWMIFWLTGMAAVIIAGIYRVVKVINSEGQLYRVSSDYYITFNFDEYESGPDYYNAYTWDSILRDDPIVEEALAVLPKDYTKEEIKASITGEMLGDYRILTVHATSKDPVRAEEIAYAYTQSLARFAEKIDMLGTIEIWSREKCLPVVEKDLTGNALLLGAVLGFVFSVFAVAFFCLLDDSVYVESDFTDCYEIPFLGMITKKGSAFCKQELKENVSYLLGKDKTYYCVNVAVGKETEGSVFEKLKEIHNGISGELSLQGSDLDTLRNSSGAVLLIPWGEKNGKTVKKTVSFLQKQDCIIAGAVIYQADDRFLKRYYSIK